jgi:hypothetical protein
VQNPLKRNPQLKNQLKNPLKNQPKNPLKNQQLMLKNQQRPNMNLKNPLKNQVCLKL